MNFRKSSKRPLIPPLIFGKLCCKFFKLATKPSKVAGTLYFWKALGTAFFKMYLVLIFISSVRSSSGYHGLLHIRSTHFFKFFKFFRFESESESESERTQHVLYFWKAWDSRISNMTFQCIKCNIHKYTNTKCLKVPTSAIFFKSIGFKDIKYNIPVYQM